VLGKMLTPFFVCISERKVKNIVQKRDVERGKLNESNNTVFSDTPFDQM